MADAKTVLDRGLLGFEPAGDAFERTLDLADRRRRTRRISTIVVALVVAAAGSAGAFAVLRSAAPAPRPAGERVVRTNVADLGLVRTVRLPGHTVGMSTSGAAVLVAGTDPASDLVAFPTACADPARGCRVLWHGDAGPGRVTMPKQNAWIADGVAYVGADDLAAFDVACATDGGACEPLWIGRVQGRAYDPVVSNGVVYVASSARRLYAFPTVCATTGGGCSPLWISARQPSRMFHPVVADGRIFVGGVTDRRTGHRGIAVFPTDCTGVRCEPLGTMTVTASELGGTLPVVVGQRLYLGTGTGPEQGLLRAYATTCVLEPRCDPVWRANVDGVLNVPDPIAAGGVVYVGSRFGASFVKAFPADCADPCPPLWTASGVPDIAFGSGFVLQDGVLYVASNSAGLYAFPASCGRDNASCRPLWTFGTGRNGSSAIGFKALVPTGDGLFAASGDGRLYVFALGGSHPTSPRASGWAIAAACALALGAFGVVALRRRRRSLAPL
jgi:outer membrane protein assembly factor BamB